MSRLLVVALAFLALTRPMAASATEPLQVIHDSGRSIPFAPYVAQLVGGLDEDTVLPNLPFPLESRLRPGVLAKDGVQVFDPAWLTQPMVVLAADDRSMRWLRFNHERLAQLRAVGIVVQAQDIYAFKALQALAQQIPVTPDTSPWLAQRLLDAGAGVYPVLVHTDGRAYQILGALP